MRDDDYLPASLNAAGVRQYIAFDGNAADPIGEPSPQAKLQSEGVAGLWALLAKRGFAYLGDEVGMGKTRQAMAVIATQLLSKPDSRIVIVCAGKTLQTQWQREWEEFLGKCYRLRDGRLLEPHDGTPIVRLRLHENLRSFIDEVRLDDARVHLLRYSSFSRPLHWGGAKSVEDLVEHYQRTIGLPVTEAERERLNLALDKAERLEKPRQMEIAARVLAESYCDRIGGLMETGRADAAEAADLVVFDEAQYLRHTGNYQNRHIARIFRGRAARWLFLSATPLHSGSNDIQSLDTYLCRTEAGAPADPARCRDCGHAGRCSAAARQISLDKTDVVDVLRQMLIRRPRTYADAGGRHYNKVMYRLYKPVSYDGASDPLLAMTMSLVQKRLVDVLAGKNNRFRQGECASFESLSRSVARNLPHTLKRKDEPDDEPDDDVEAELVAGAEFEPARDRKRHAGDDIQQAPDRTFIDELNVSFEQAMKRAGSLSGVPGLPHAKLNKTAEDLFAHSLRNGSNDKTLVFVRRIDTVEELRDRLHAAFQQHVDARVREWAKVIGPWGVPKAPLMPADFWTRHALDEADDQDDLPGDDGGNTETDGIRTPYFEALKRKSGTTKENGKLVSLSSRLLNPRPQETGPLDGFLLVHDTPEVTARNMVRWKALLGVLMGPAFKGEDWLYAEPGRKEAGWKLATLQRCLLQSLRQTDFLVDLYVLHAHVGQMPEGVGHGLAEKLIWVLGEAAQPRLGALAPHFANWREKLRRWILQFDLIVDKCLRTDSTPTWDRVYERVDRVFVRMAPVVGRSGRLRNGNAVPQFKLPTHPNILICTDVLKEGVDMHLFCDRVMHYGVAWTSGDLEQRIGRVDRFGSLISQRIGSYHAGADQGLPRLGVIFPYLNGTLDRYQAERVMRRKKESEWRLDLAKRGDESDEMDVSTAGGAGGEGTARALPVPGESPNAVFFPDFARRVVDGVEPTPLCLPVSVSRVGQDPLTGHPERRRHLAAWHAVAVAKDVDLPASTRLACCVPAEAATSTGKRKKKTFEVAYRLEWLAPRQPDAWHALPGGADLAEVLAVSAPCAVRGNPALTAQGFVWDADSNTLALSAGISATDVLARPNVDGAKVLLESVGDDAFWLVRAQVASEGSLSASADERPSWMASVNRGRRWGYLVADAGQVWVVAFVRKAGDAELPLLRNVGRALRRAALHYGSSDARAATARYRSPTGFPSLQSICKQYGVQSAGLTAMFGKNVTGFSMKNEDLQACGQFLADVPVWFAGVFSAVLDSLYEAAEIADENRGLDVGTPALLDGGILHIQTEGAERFRLQAWLDLQGTQGNRGMPTMMWELAASPLDKGPAPQLPLSALNEMPHADVDGWEADDLPHQYAYTLKGEKYRHLAVSHSPASWDGSRDALMQAWCAALAWMRHPTTFQRRYCRAAFETALKP
ncbi:DEAD/DEAH box helicase [Cupriavidus plantarum]|uniref:Type III restriction/modification enzyme restriction subunit n=1 Tax=Cupriavidus plantarum TaxID=942865 RepID=A0A316EZ80_9BURK|nr:DEAD/DEAH box helicase [Cupriavidus plantarum]PWK37681.1 type III restriction/modification enzyme restriction subunit [Cupriavidus plantarum]